MGKEGTPIQSRPGVLHPVPMGVPPSSPNMGVPRVPPNLLARWRYPPSDRLGYPHWPDGGTPSQEGLGYWQTENSTFPHPSDAGGNKRSRSIINKDLSVELVQWNSHLSACFLTVVRNTEGTGENELKFRCVWMKRNRKGMLVKTWFIDLLLCLLEFNL